jgi:sterol desaturase/sphingolipid hydroxylase (fatty acid hydroxylase superfamily)
MPVSKLSPIILGSFFLFLLLMESIYPLRKVVISRWVRISRNISLALVGYIIIKLIFLPYLVSLANFAQEKNLGLLNILNLSFWAKILCSIVLLDFTLYFWHFANHKIPFLWRFHLVHHTDLEMDVSTASRFHFGELILSVFFRAFQILIFGIDPIGLLIFETSITFFAFFHHSNFKLPLPFERALNKIIVTPRMHAIHHSQILKETDSNFSTILSFWDRPFKTLSLNIPQKDITIGVSSYREPKELLLSRLLILPFRKIRNWVPLQRKTPNTPKEFLCG